MLRKQKQLPTIATLGSHSALEICRGAKDVGFSTLVITQKGRGKTYAQHYKSRGTLGCVDNIIEVDQFDELLNKPIIKNLQRKLCIFIPNRSFEVYLHFNYRAIEKKFPIPMFGNRKLLKIEERGVRPNQYDLLDAASIRYPAQFTDPKDIDRLCLVKVLEKTRRFERAFFLANSYKDYQQQVREKLRGGIFTQQQLDHAVIEEFVVGVQVNFTYFYSPTHKRLELLGTDTRRQTNIEGLTKIPATYQHDVLEKLPIYYEEAGHMAVTVLESLLEKAFELGERFVAASQKLTPPGIIGPFALQTIVVPGPPKKDIITIDVSPRMPGSPGITATPYAAYLFGEPVSAGKRIAWEIHDAIQSQALDKVVT